MWWSFSYQSCKILWHQSSFWEDQLHALVMGEYHEKDVRHWTQHTSLAKGITSRLSCSLCRALFPWRKALGVGVRWVEGQQGFLQDGDTTELCFVTEQIDSIFHVKKKRSVSCYFQFILLFSKRLISYDLKKKDDHSWSQRDPETLLEWHATKRRPSDNKGHPEALLYLKISTITHSKLLMEWSYGKPL